MTFPNSGVRVGLIVAMASNRVIGRGAELPWHLPDDLKHFRELTMGKPIVMGRLTWDSIGRPLPGRTSIVVSRQPGLRIDGAEVREDLTSALSRAREIAQRDGVSEVMVIGGAQIYALALGQAERIYLTEVLSEVDGDIRFPEIDPDQWDAVESGEVLEDASSGLRFRYRVLQRAARPG